MQMNLGVPTARAAHVMCAVDKLLVIFGGRDIESRQSDVHIFNTGRYMYCVHLILVFITARTEYDIHF